MSKVDWGKAPNGADLHVEGCTPNWWRCTNGGGFEYWGAGEWHASQINPTKYFSCDAVTFRAVEFQPFTSIEDAQQEGRKFDAGKVIMGAIPPDAELAVARVLTFGAEKYARDNWRKVPDMGVRYMDAALRHLNSYRRGELVDAESGESHLAHAACCIMFLLQIKEE